MGLPRKLLLPLLRLRAILLAELLMLLMLWLCRFSGYSVLGVCQTVLLQQTLGCRECSAVLQVQQSVCCRPAWHCGGLVC